MATRPIVATPPTAPLAAPTDDPAKEREEYFTQYWHYATNLRNWFIAYGVGGIFLLTRGDTVFATSERGAKVMAILLFVLGLFAQVILTWLNKTVHFYAYQKRIVQASSRRHRWAETICECFWIDIGFDSVTALSYAWGSVILWRLLTH